MGSRRSSHGACGRCWPADRVTAWVAALFVGFLVIGLSRDRSAKVTSRLVILIILVVIGYEAAKIHAI